jgi:uncharacterized membrane protein
MTLFHMLKSNAKRALQGNWGKAIAAPVLLLVCWGLLSLLRMYALELFANASGDALMGPGYSIPQLLLFRASSAETIILTIFLFVVILLETPLLLGIMRWYYRMVQGQTSPFADIFVYYESLRLYCKSIWLFITVFVRSLLWAFGFLTLPSILLSLSIGVVNNRFRPLFGDTQLSATVGTMGVTISALLLALTAVLYIVFMNRYALTFYLFFDDPDGKITGFLKTSIHYTSGYRASMTAFSLSFIGWFLLCFWFIPLFYVVPYCVASVALYARYIIERCRRETEEHTREFAMEDEPAPLEEDILAPIEAPPADFFPRNPRAYAPADMATDPPYDEPLPLFGEGDDWQDADTEDREE